MNENNTKPLKVVSLAALIGEGLTKWKNLAWPRGFLLLTIGFVIPHLLFTFGTKSASMLRVADIQNWVHGESGGHDPFILAQHIMGFAGDWLFSFCLLVAVIYWSLLGYQKLLANPRLGIGPAYRLALRPTLIRDLFVVSVFGFLAVLGSWMIIPMLIFVSAALLVPIVIASRPNLTLRKLFGYCLGLSFRSRDLSYLGALFSLLSLTCCFYLAQTLVDGFSSHAMYFLSMRQNVQDCSGQLLTWCAWDVNLVYLLSLYLSYLILLILQGSLRFFYYTSK